jgi:hypothetical protein
MFSSVAALFVLLLAANCIEPASAAGAGVLQVADLETALVIIVFTFIATMYFFGHRAKTPNSVLWTPMFIIEGAFVCFHVLAWIIYAERSEAFQRAPTHNPGYGQAFLVINVLLIGITVLIGCRGAILNVFYGDMEPRSTVGRGIKRKMGPDNGWHIFGVVTILIAVTSVTIMSLLTWWYKTLNGHNQNFIYVVFVYALGTLIYAVQSGFTWWAYHPTSASVESTGTKGTI